MKSSISSAGSPKNIAPPWLSRLSSWRWIAPIVALVTLPYLAESSSACPRAIGEHRLQVVEVEQQQALLVGLAEDDVEHAFLRLVEVEQAGEQQRAHFRNRRADRVALLAEQVPEHRRIVRIGIVVHAQLLRPAFERVGVLERGRAGHGNARQVALHVGDEHRHARWRKSSPPAPAASPSCRCPVAPAIRPWRLARLSSSVWRSPFDRQSEENRAHIRSRRPALPACGAARRARSSDRHYSSRS